MRCARGSEVGCEKNVYRVDEVVCTKQLVGGGRGGGVGGGEKWGYKSEEVGWVVEVEIRSEEQSKKIKEVEAELD
ncbi:hypothetical protein PMAC_001516 [Pneumocystis sp. 'macacae']|nr:hypothetical protein PMAC_001516 [Pneumocystis sp. 'macacae']